MWLLHPFWSFLRTRLPILLPPSTPSLQGGRFRSASPISPGYATAIKPIPLGREVSICTPASSGYATAKIQYTIMGRRYISDHGGREAHLESKADGQRVSIWPSAQGSGSWMDANSRHHRGNGLAFLPLLAILGLCPSDWPPLQTQEPSAPSTPFWCICPIMFLVVSLLTV